MQVAFKKYKNKTYDDLTSVVDCSRKDDEKIIKVDLDREIPRIGLLPTTEWNIYKFREKPGLILIKNPFSAVGQRYWIQRLVRDYTKHPHPNNLLASRFNEKVIKDFWSSLNDESNEDQRRLIKKSMRWSTLGYHYDWTAKVYDENYKNEFPPELRNLIGTFAGALSFEGYKSEAAIINFYPIGTTLSAHTDHSEFSLECPLFSLSFGQSAIFLIGGTDKESEALPIRLDSGDVLVMSEGSRLCYHAVPRVFQGDRQPWNANEDLTSCSDLIESDVKECLGSKWAKFEKYLSDSRINVNVRQVNK